MLLWVKFSPSLKVDAFYRKVTSFKTNLPQYCTVNLMPVPLFSPGLDLDDLFSQVAFPASLDLLIGG